MKHSQLAAHDQSRPYLIQWTNVDRADERFATIEQAIRRMVACGFEATTWADALESCRALTLPKP